MKKSAVSYPLHTEPSLPEAANYHGFEKNWLISLCRFQFTTAPEWRISFHWVLGLCSEKRKQQLLLSQHFVTPSPWKEKNLPFLKIGTKSKKSPCQGNGSKLTPPVRPLSPFLTPTNFILWKRNTKRIYSNMFWMSHRIFNEENSPL